MEDKVITYGNVPFADIAVGNIVKVADYYDQVAVGIVEKKEETIKMKSIAVRFGFEGSSVHNVIMEEKTPISGHPMYTLLEVIRSYV